MAFLDPPEGVRIGELLKAGQPVAAAELLLASSNREHKALRPLVADCVDQLMTAAQAALADNQVLNARDHSQLAAELRPLSGDHAVLHTQIVAVALDFERRTAGEQAAVERSRKLADAGRLQTSIESLASLQHLNEGKELLLELSVRDGTVQRHVAEFAQRVDAGDLRGAEVILEKIEDVAQSRADALGLRHRLLEAKRAMQVRPVTSALDVADASTFDWMLDFGHEGRNTLLVFGHALVIGSASTNHTTADIQVAGPMLHRQHAVILRHFRDKEMRYWLLSHPSHDKFVAVNGDMLTTGSDGLRPSARTGKPQADTQLPPAVLGCALLKDGDVIQMGESQHNAGVRMVFRQRSATMQNGDSAGGSCLQATAGLQFDALCPGSFQKQGINFRNLALVHRELRLGSPTRSVDLPLQMDFDCAIDYRLTQGSLRVEVDGSFTDLRVPGVDSDDENIIQPRSVLVLKRHMESKGMHVTHRCW